RDPRPPVAYRHRRDVPRAPRRARPVRLHQPGRRVQRWRGHRDRRAGRRRRAAPPDRHAAGPGEGARPARPRRRANPRWGGGRRRVRTRRSAPDPAPVQGPHRRRPHRVQGLTMPSNRYRYGAWRGGPDPLAPPYDVRAAVDQVGAEVLAGGSLREALRNLLRRGLQGSSRGLDGLAARARRLRREAMRRGNLDGAVTRAQALLDQALAAEREELGRRDTDDARFAEATLDNLPRSTARAVEELREYNWASDEARR